MIDLNEAQKAAVCAPDGPGLVLAGAGSGKTRVIVERMAWLVEERGVDPRFLLALTFTNKAANEMKQRLAQRLGVDRLASFLGTFHSFGLYVLRREIDRLGRSKNFTIFDDADQLSLMKRLVKDMGDSYEHVSPRAALSWISRLKQSVQSPDWAMLPAFSAETAYRELWKRYHAALEAASTLDFDDLLVLLVKLFDQNADILAKYQDRYRYVLIDEYQDTNRAQYLIARRLSDGHGNILVVGDEDQSIYSWRGADINNILDFSRDFPLAQMYRLEQNYRSTGPILDAANRVVKNNVNRLGKNLWTARKEGAPVRFFLAEEAGEEADFIVDDLLKRRLSPREAAVLYRTNSQSRMLEDALRKRGVHYTVVGGIRFYSRKEIKDITAYLRLIVNPKDDESLRRILNVPPRGIGGVTRERIEEYAALRGISFLEVLREIETDETLAGRARQSAAELVGLLDDLTMEAKTSSVGDLVETLLNRIDYRDFVMQSDEKDYRSRIEIVDEFVVACREHDRTTATGLLDFMNALSLASDMDDWDADTPAVTLMTCHSAKGLEFGHVYIAGLEEGQFPLLREEDGQDDIEEERRLCYVAMTRACETLTLCAAQSRMIYGRTDDHRQVSRFVREIGDERLERLNEDEDSSLPGGPRRTGAAPRTGYGVKRPAAPGEPVDKPDSGQVRMGARVRHAQWGRGVVMFVTGEGPKARLRIKFDTGMVKTVVFSMAPLEILEGK